MGIEKKIAYYDSRMNPNPLTEGIDGMWITRSEPYTVTRVWRSEDERPRLAEEPSSIRGWTEWAAHEEYDFRPIRKKR